MTRIAPILLAALLAPSALAAAIEPILPPLPSLPPVGSVGLDGIGVSVGPNNIIVLEPGWSIAPALTGLRYPTALKFRGSELLVLEAGRYPYADSYHGQDEGNLTAFALDAQGHVLAQRRVATRLADPLGLSVGPDGAVWVAQYGRVSRIDSAAYDAGGTVLPEDWSWGYPNQTSDLLYLPVTGQQVGDLVGFDPVTGATTGPMGLAVRPGDGRLFVSVAEHGRPPDDDGLRQVTGVDYDNPYSSSVMAPTGGAIDVGQRAARACRNCYDLAFAPAGRPDAGTLYETENVGVYRARLFAGSNRSVLAGSSVADVNLLDGVDQVDLQSGHVRRVATFRPDVATGGIAPTGMAFASGSFRGHAGEMFVALFSGFVPPTDDRGGVDHVLLTDNVTGAGLSLPFILGLDFPTGLAFGPDGAMYVCEFYNGIVWRIAPV